MSERKYISAFRDYVTSCHEYGMFNIDFVLVDEGFHKGLEKDMYEFTETPFNSLGFLEIDEIPVRKSSKVKDDKMIAFFDVGGTILPADNFPIDENQPDIINHRYGCRSGNYSEFSPDYQSDDVNYPFEDIAEIMDWDLEFVEEMARIAFGDDNRITKENIINCLSVEGTTLDDLAESWGVSKESLIDKLRE